ncbi:t-SNARE [Basidiobolus meristosporus CBS 931.73]|uniref:t-SNARE n=1 Tax=Basidiobolus meristosporus CBS 931.73 TaxID=1314790 RepID=A0A1Y1WZN3_9FUNG|nr:t-SNARE [Basidiobolus meristosporus CBS 931.73]|eukprot:ORX78554.1 t-SNARE [Basidiobolus meristosporus CBS 931.73]
MSIKNRTFEFQAAVDSLRSRSSRPSRNGTEKNALIRPESHNGIPSKTEFSHMAGAIGRDINSTAAKLQKLTKLAKRKTLFDDKPTEISELTYVIKQDIARLNQQIANLQRNVRENKSGRKNAKQIEEHNNNVVVMLQSKLMNASLSFKDVLEMRTSNMKATKDRKEQFMESSAPLSIGPSTDSPLFHFERKQEDPTNGEFVALDFSTQSAQQLQLVEQQGTSSNSLAHMVAEQREAVQRIDANVDDIEMNVSGAQKELLKYYAHISSNRWLMAKIFAIIVVFFLIFVVVL